MDHVFPHLAPNLLAICSAFSKQGMFQDKLIEVMASKRSWPALLLAAATPVSCSAPFVNRGADLYSEGHYVEAAEVFERTESRVDQAPIQDRARYAFYRGATLLALGDVRRADHWLGYAQNLVQVSPDSLSREERVKLDHALRASAERHPAGVVPVPRTALARQSEHVPFDPSAR